MGETNRRDFLKYVGAAAATFGGLKPERAQAQHENLKKDQKKEVEGKKKLFEGIQGLKEAYFPFLFHEAYKTAEYVEGVDAITKRLLSELEERKPKLFIVGEYHTQPVSKFIFMKLLKEYPEIRVVAQEAIDHGTKDGQYKGGLLTLDSFSHEEEQVILGEKEDERLLAFTQLKFPSYLTLEKIKEYILVRNEYQSLVKEEKISPALLHDLYHPEKEIQTNVLGLCGSDEAAAVYTGAFHAMKGPGDEKGFTQQNTYFDEAKKQNINVFGVNSIDVESHIKQYIENVTQLIAEYVRIGGSVTAEIEELLINQNEEIRQLLPKTDENNSSTPKLFVFKEKSFSDQAAMVLGGLDPREQAVNVSDLIGIFSNSIVKKLCEESVQIQVHGFDIVIRTYNGDLYSINGFSFSDQKNTVEISISRLKEQDGNVLRGDINSFVGQRSKDGSWDYKKK